MPTTCKHEWTWAENGLNQIVHYCKLCGSKDTPDKVALRTGTHEPAVDDFGNQYLARVPKKTQILGRVGKIVVQESENESITREKLARALCEHAAMLNYDHGAGPTIDMNVGACPRHIGMAHAIIESMWKEDIIGK